MSRCRSFADRRSVNLEFTSEKALASQAPGKTHQALLAPMAFIGSDAFVSTWRGGL